MSRKYTKEIRKHLGYSATWLPNTKVRLGDVVVLSDNTYRRTAGADEFDLEFSTRESEGQILLDYASADQVKINVFGSGSGPEVLAPNVDMRAGLKVEFKSADAILFQAGPCTISEIDDLKSIGEKVLALYEKEEWKENFVLVTEVIYAERATILIASAANAEMVCNANANAKLGPTSFIDANAGLEVVTFHNISTRIVSDTGLTPLFRGFAVRKPLLRRGSRFGPSRFGPIRSQQQPTFAEIDWEDFV